MKFVPSALLMLFAVAFFCIWLLERRRPHLMLYALAFLTISAATIVQFALWPADIGYNTIVSASLYSAAPLLLVEGVLKRSGKSMPLWLHAAWFCAIVGSLAYFYYGDNNLQVRVYLLNFGMGCILLNGAWLLRELARGSVIDRAMLWLVFGLALTFIARTMVTGGSVPTDNVAEFFVSDFWIWTQFAMSILGVAMGLGLLLVGCADIIYALVAERDSDPLTGLLNRRGLQACAPKLLATVKREPVSVVACDLDNFKAINDRFGHASGDAVLAAFAGVIRAKVRAGDVAARVGGEEFVVVLKGSAVGDAYGLTERLRREIASARIEGLPDDFAVTASFGIAELHVGEDLWDAAERADKILYAAKRAGRNRTFAEGLQLPYAA